MAIKMSQFVLDNTFSVLLNFPSKIKGVVNNSSSGYVLDRKFTDKISVIDYLKSNVEASDTKIIQALQLVKLKSSLHTTLLAHLTKAELKKVQLAEVLLVASKVIICEYFFEDLIYSEKEYFKRFFRNLMYKKGISIIFIENDMNFVCETVSKFYLFTKNGKYKLITDFYDDEIYQYVETPFTVELVKFFESKGHVIDHDVTFNETLKAIYRGVQ
mgnify:FL=1